MRYKIVPPARDVPFLRDVSAALPRVPNSVEDCCSRIRDRTDVPSRDLAREYLTFCQALGLAAEADGAYYRPQNTPEDAELAAAFRENVLGAREVLAAMDSVEGKESKAGEEGEEVLSVEEAFDAIEPLVPRWERNQKTDWEATWRERTERLCEWAVAFGLAAAEEGGYRVRNVDVADGEE